MANYAVASAPRARAVQPAAPAPELDLAVLASAPAPPLSGMFTQLDSTQIVLTEDQQPSLVPRTESDINQILAMYLASTIQSAPRAADLADEAFASWIVAEASHSTSQPCAALAAADWSVAPMPDDDGALAGSFTPYEACVGALPPALPLSLASPAADAYPDSERGSGIVTPLSSFQHSLMAQPLDTRQVAAKLRKVGDGHARPAARAERDVPESPAEPRRKVPAVAQPRSQSPTSPSSPCSQPDSPLRPLTEEEKKLDKRARNKISAAKSRARKHDLIKTLQDQVDELTRKNMGLTSDLNVALQRIEFFESIFKARP